MDLVFVLTGALGLVLGFCLGYGVRAYISVRRRRLWRAQRDLPLHQAPLLAPDVERQGDEAKLVQ